VLESRRKNVSRPGVMRGRLSDSRRQRNPQDLPPRAAEPQQPREGQE
jgi:hypothetical protein